MDYIDKINTLLNPKNKFQDFLVVDLFAGSGGLSLGFEAIGFPTVGFEKDKDSILTYNFNLNGKSTQTLIDENIELPSASILIGGPPCQPFSVGGKQKGLKDTRNGFPAFLTAIKKLDPQIFLIENVRGMLYKNKEYLNELLDTFKELGYATKYKLINAANYGVPQKRQRIFIIGYKSAINEFEFPLKLSNQVTSGEALEDLVSIIPEQAKFLTQSMDEYIARYEKASRCRTPRDLHLDKVSRTVTCRNLAGATGDMMRVKLVDTTNYT